MEAAEALAETRRLLGLGLEQILRITPENFELHATDAWPAFRRGVVRAEGCREVPSEELLRDLEGKPTVLTFLADLAERKRGYRRQVETVLRILLKGQAWLEVALADRALCERLPGSEVAELLAKGAELAPPAAPAVPPPLEAASKASAEPAAADVPAPPPALADGGRTQSRYDVVTTLESTFRALVTMGNKPDLDEAAAAAREFSSAVSEILQRSYFSDMDVLAGLEPKAPMLRALCTLHEERRSERSCVTALLLNLMERPELCSWRAAADADDALRRELEGLGVMDHAYSNEAPGANSGDERLSDAPCASSAVSSCSEPGLQAKWMWRDAGSYGGRFAHTLANLNPARWSASCSVEETITSLERYVDTPSGERPVKVKVYNRDAEVTTVKSTNVPEAIAALRAIFSQT